MKIFYHNDLDGRCAGAIAWRSPMINKESNCELIEIDYKDDVPINCISDDERIIILDFSFKPVLMNKVLKKTLSVVWIDHHQTAFEYNYGHELCGLRNNFFSGCELAWKYYFPENPIPRAVELIGDRDKWAWKYGEETANFNMGIRIYSHQPKDGIWDDLFTGERIFEVIKAGAICIKFRDNFCGDYANSYGFETEFEGFKCFALGLYEFGSEAFGIRMEKYDICLSFEFVGNKWVVGLFSDDIDVSQIAKKYGGGGHKHASGFVCKELPFKKS